MFSLLAVVVTVLLVGGAALWRGVARLRRRLAGGAGADGALRQGGPGLSSNAVPAGPR